MRKQEFEPSAAVAWMSVAEKRSKQPESTVVGGRFSRVCVTKF